MLTVHHLNNSRSQRILWLLEEIGIPYEIKFYQRDPKTMLAPPELRKIHPLGKAPVVTDGNFVLAESGAIIEYILDKYDTEGKFRAAPLTSERYRLNYWLHYAEGSAMPPLLLKLIFAILPKRKMPFFMKPVVKGISTAVNHSFIDPQLKLHFNYLEGELNKFTWFAGENFSAADIQMSFPIEAAEARGIIDEKHPKLKAYLKKIHTREAYQRALQKGGPYDLLS